MESLGFLSVPLFTFTLITLAEIGECKLDEAKVMAKIEQAWNRPEKLNS